MYNIVYEIIWPKNIFKWEKKKRFLKSNYNRDRGPRIEFYLEGHEISKLQEKISNIIKESLKFFSSEEPNYDKTLSVPLKIARENFEKEYLRSQLKKFGGNISKMAKFIGMERSALHRKLKGLNIKDLN